MADEWSACLQTLEGHSEHVRLVAFSHDSTRLALASYDNTVKIWETSSGRCLQTVNVGATTYDISFDAGSNLRLRTEVGMLDLDQRLGLITTLAITISQAP